MRIQLYLLPVILKCHLLVFNGNQAVIAETVANGNNARIGGAGGDSGGGRTSASYGSFAFSALFGLVCLLLVLMTGTAVLRRNERTASFVSSLMMVPHSSGSIALLIFFLAGVLGGVTHFFRVGLKRFFSITRVKSSACEETLPRKKKQQPITKIFVQWFFIKSLFSLTRVRRHLFDCPISINTPSCKSRSNKNSTGELLSVSKQKTQPEALAPDSGPTILFLRDF